MYLNRMWHFRSVIRGLNQLSRLYSNRISYCDLITIDPDLMFMKKTNADILRLKKQMYALENARVKLHEQIQETIHMIKSLRNSNPQDEMISSSTSAAGKEVLQEQEQPSTHNHHPNIIYVEEGLVDNKTENSTASSTEFIPANEVGKMEQVQYQTAANQLESSEAKSDTEVEEQNAKQDVNEMLLNAEKEVENTIPNEQEAKPATIAMAAKTENEEEGKASVIDKEADDEQLIKVILKDESIAEYQNVVVEQSPPVADSAVDEAAEEDLGISSNDLEAATAAVKLNAGQQIRKVKYTDENILDIFQKVTENTTGTVLIIQNHAGQNIQEITMLQKQKQHEDNSEPPHSPLAGGQGVGGENASSPTMTSNQAIEQQAHDVPIQQEQQQQPQQQQEKQQEQAKQQQGQAKQTEPVANPALVHFQTIDKVTQLLAEKNINLNGNKPIIIIVDKPIIEKKATTLLPNDKNIALETELYYTEDKLFYQESIAHSNSGKILNQIYSTLAPSNSKNQKQQETIVMVSKYVPNVEQIQTKRNEIAAKMKKPKVYTNFVPKFVSQLKGMEDEQWEFEQHSENAKAHAKTVVEQHKLEPILP